MEPSSIISEGIIQKATCRVFAGYEQGTGWLCSNDGYIMTAGHVITENKMRDVSPSEDKVVDVMLWGQRARILAKVIYASYRDTETEFIDFALLKINISSEMPFIPIDLTEGHSHISLGETIYISGYGERDRLQSTDKGEYISPSYIENKTKTVMLKVRCIDAAQRGISGAAVYSLKSLAAIGIQTKVSKYTSGATRDSILAFPVGSILSALKKEVPEAVEQFLASINPTNELPHRKTPAFTWLALSDMHFGRNGDKDYIFINLLQTIRDDAELRNTDYVFIAGDIADKADFSVARDMLKQLVDSFSGHTTFFSTIGNHDINRNGNGIREMLIKSAFHSGRSESYKQFKGMVDRDGLYDALIKGSLEDYLSLSQTVLNEVWTEEEIMSQVRLYSDGKLNLLILNTSLTSCDDNDRGRLFVNLKGIIHKLAKLNEGLPIFVMGHHPIDSWDTENHSVYRDIAHSRTDLYICGHSPDIRSAFEYTGDVRDEGSSSKSSGYLKMFLGSCTGYWSHNASFVRGFYGGDATCRIEVFAYNNNCWNVNENSLSQFTYGAKAENGVLTFPRISRILSNKAYVPIIIPHESQYEDTKRGKREFSTNAYELASGNPIFQTIITQMESGIDIDSTSTYTFTINNQKKTVQSLRLEEALRFILMGANLPKTKNQLDDCYPVSLYRQNKIMFLLGNGGTGKTYSLFKAWHNLRAELEILYIQLHDISSSSSPIQDYIKRVLFGENENNFLKFRQHWSAVNNDGIPLVLFLDGLNEINYDKQDKVYVEINELCSLWNVFIVVSSRYTDNLRLHIDYAFRADMCKLTDTQITDYVLKIKGSRYKKTLSNLFENMSLIDLLRNPLMLSLYVQTTNVYDPFAFANKDKPFVEKLKGCVRFYLPEFSESTIIWNFNQYQLHKELKSVDTVNGILAWFEYSLMLPYICFRMQYNGEFIITDEQLDAYIDDSLKHYKNAMQSNAIENLKRLKSFLKTDELIYEILKAHRLKDLATDSFSLLYSLSTYNGGDDVATFGLFHQQLRDCLAAMFLINEIELFVPKNAHDIEITGAWCHRLAAENKSVNQYMLRHVAFLEQKNGLVNLNRLWNLTPYLQGYSILTNNLLSVYNYVYDGNLSGINFSNIDLRYTSLESFSFQIPDSQKNNKLFNPSIFSGSIFGVKTFSLRGHSGCVYSIECCGNYLLSYGGGSVRLWDISTRVCLDIIYNISEESEALETSGKLNNQATFLSNTANVVCYTAISKVVEHHIDAPERDRYYHLGDDIAFGVCYSPSKKYIAITDNSGVLYIWSRKQVGNTFDKTTAKTYRSDYYFKANISNKRCVQVLDNVVFLVNFARNKREQLLNLDREVVTAVSFSEEHSILAVGTFTSGENERHATGLSVVYVLETESRNLLQRIEVKDSYPIMDLSFSSDGEIVILANLISGGAAYNLHTKEKLYTVGGICNCVCTYHETKNPISDAFSRYSFFGTVDGNIAGYEYSNGVPYCLSFYDGHKPSANCISVKPDSKRLIVGYEDSTIREWSIKSGRLIHVYSDHISAIHSVEFDKSGEFFVSGDELGYLKIWDAYAKTMIFTVKAHTEAIRDLKFSDDGKLFSCGNDGHVKVWDIETQSLLLVFPKMHTDVVKCIVYYSNSNSKYLISGSTDKTIIIWNVSDYANIHPVCEPISMHTRRIRSLAINKESATFLSNSEDEAVCEWKIEDGTPVMRAVIPCSEENQRYRAAEALAVSMAGDCIILSTEGFGYRNKSAKAKIEKLYPVKDTNPLESRGELLIHTGLISEMALFDEDTMLATASLDGSVAVIDISNLSIERRIEPISQISEKLKGYDLSHTVFSPRWIRSYYLGMNAKKEVSTLDSDSVSKFGESLARSVMLNLFDFAKEDKDIEILVDEIFRYTAGIGEPGDFEFEKQEREFFLANAEYLWYEAPRDEQTMFMMLELFRAFDINKAFEAESDLDRLFKLLEDKDSAHIALGKYKGFKKNMAQKSIVASCIRRMFPLSCIFDFTETDTIEKFRSSPDIVEIYFSSIQAADLDNLVASFIANTNRQLFLSEVLDEVSENKAEYLLIRGIFAYLLDRDVMISVSETETIIKSFDMITTSNESLNGELRKFLDTSDSERETAIKSLNQRLGFWREFR